MKQKLVLFLTVPFVVFGSTAHVAKAPSIPSKKFRIENKNHLSPIPLTKNISQAEASPSSPEMEETQEEECIEEEDVLPTSAARSAAFVDSGYQRKFYTTLVFICTLILFSLIVIYVYRKGAPMSKIVKKNSRNNIKILERRALSQQTYLYHIQVGEKQFILSESKVDVRNVANLNLIEPTEQD